MFHYINYKLKTTLNKSTYSLFSVFNSIMEIIHIIFSILNKSLWIVKSSNNQWRKSLEICRIYNKTNLKSVDMNLDPSDVAFLERGKHVQDWVEAAPPGETDLKMRIMIFTRMHCRLNLFNSKSKYLFKHILCIIAIKASDYFFLFF